MSTYTDRYQSRFFNFVAQQSLRLGNATAKAARHIRFAAETAVQAALYPVYALFQTVRRRDRQVQAGHRQRNPLPPTDGPIQEILEDIGHLNLTPQPIQALASSCADGHLVLITPDNQVLDLLTPQQQNDLDQQLLQAIAVYWHQTLKAVRPVAKPYPVRVFRRAMGWVQRSPLALSLNWFQETDIVERPPKHQPSSPRERHPSALSPESIARIDRHIAYLENEYLLPIVEEPEPVWIKVRLLIKAAIAYFFGSANSENSPERGLNPSHFPDSNAPLTGVQQPRLTSSGGMLNTHSNPVTVTSRRADHAKFYQRIQGLIEGAIAYFFNLDSPRHPNRYPKKPLTPNRSDRPLPNPWDTPELAAQYPFGIIAAATAACPLPEAVNLKHPLGEFPATSIHPKPAQHPTAPQPAESGLPQVVRPSSQAMTATPISDSSGDMAIIDPHSQNEWQPDFKPEWIETYVNDVHYVRHPLEVVLHWLDNLLLKLETWAIKLWKRLFR